MRAAAGRGFRGSHAAGGTLRSAPMARSRIHPLLADVSWLAAHLHDEGLRIVDVRWSLKATGRADWARGHIEGARFLDLEGEISAPTGPGRHPIPSPYQLERVLSAAGIGVRDTVVAYDDAGGSIAARLSWLLRHFGHRGEVKVLDGGLQAWTDAGHPLSTAVPEVKPAKWVAGPRRFPVVDRNGVDELKGRPDVLLFDARAPERFRGESEPVDSRPGHVPGALNAPWSGNLAGGRFLEPAALKARFRALGVKSESRVLVMCGSGVTACHDILALQMAGHPDGLVALYEGSWSDWSRDAELPVATGDSASATAGQAKRGKGGRRKRTEGPAAPPVAESRPSDGLVEDVVVAPPAVPEPFQEAQVGSYADTQGEVMPASVRAALDANVPPPAAKEAAPAPAAEPAQAPTAQA